jgi:hypothetical protein
MTCCCAHDGQGLPEAERVWPLEHGARMAYFDRSVIRFNNREAEAHGKRVYLNDDISRIDMSSCRPCARLVMPDRG